MRSSLLILTLFCSFLFSALSMRADSDILEFAEQTLDEDKILIVTPNQFLKKADGYLEIIALVTKE